MTPGSLCSHKLLFQHEHSYVRPCKFVEPMIPFMSAAALIKCRPTLLESRSGWGLDYVWAKLLNYERMAVIDAIPVTHRRDGSTGRMRFNDGASPRDEMIAIRKKYGC